MSMAEQQNAKTLAMAKAAREGRLGGAKGRPILVEARWLLAMHEAFTEGAEDPIQQWERLGTGWGKLWVRDLAQDTRSYQASPQDLDLQDLLWLITDDLARGGWGHISLDFDSFGGSGMILLEVRGGPAASGVGGVSEGAAALVAGYVAGVLGSVSDLPMEGVGVCRIQGGASIGAAVIAHRDRSAIVRRALSEGRSFNSALKAAASA